MKRWMIAVAVALLAACVAVPAEASDWCVKDPQLDIQTSHGTFTIYVTEGVLGSEHEAMLASAKVTYATRSLAKDFAVVAVYENIPSDTTGAFATRMVVSSQPFGNGTLYGSAIGTSGSTMSVWFWIDTSKVS